MKQRFFRNILFLVGINLLIKPLYILGIDTSVQNTVGPSAYGLYLALFNFSFLLQILSDFGLQNFNSRDIAQDPTKLKEVFPSILGTKLILAAVFFIGLILFSWIFGYFHLLKGLLGIIALNQVLVSFILYLRTNVASSGKYTLDALLSSIDKLILIFVLGYLLFIESPTDGFKIEHFVWAQSFSLIICLLICFWVNVRLSGVLKVKVSFAFSKKILRQSLPFASIIIMMTAYTRLDAFMLERLLNDQALEAGIYASSFRIYDASNMFGFLFASLLLPMFSSMMGRKEETRALVKMSLGLILAGAITLVVSMGFLKDEIMQFFYSNYATPYYGKILMILMISFIPVCGSYIFGTLLTAQGALRRLNIIVGIGLVINISLNILLIPEHKAFGAAIATLITQITVFILQYLASNQLFGRHVSLIFWGKIIMYTGLGLAIMYGMSMFSGFHWSIILCFGIIINILIAFPLQLISLRDLKLLWSKE